MIPSAPARLAAMSTAAEVLAKSWCPVPSPTDIALATRIAGDVMETAPNFRLAAVALHRLAQDAPGDIRDMANRLRQMSGPTIDPRAAHALVLAHYHRPAAAITASVTTAIREDDEQ